MRKILILGLLLSAFIAWADTTAVTEDGRKVLLKDNGSWEYIEEIAERASENNYDFRMTRWGMTSEQVKESETLTPSSESTNFIFYETKVANLKCLLCYSFSANDRLARGKYVITEKHANDNLFIVDYKVLAILLEGKYGNPESDDTFWRNDLYQDNPDSHGFAVSIGHVVYQKIWQLEDTEILLQLSGDNYEIFLALQYTGKNMAAVMEREAQQKTQKEL